MDPKYLQGRKELETSNIDEERRNFLTAGLVGGAVAVGAVVAGAAHAQQQTAQASPAAWWPHSKWGKDERH